MTFRILQTTVDHGWGLAIYDALPNETVDIYYSSYENAGTSGTHLVTLQGTASGYQVYNAESLIGVENIFIFGFLKLGPGGGTIASQPLPTSFPIPRSADSLTATGLVARCLLQWTPRYTYNIYRVLASASQVAYSDLIGTATYDTDEYTDNSTDLTPGVAYRYYLQGTIGDVWAPLVHDAVATPSPAPIPDNPGVLTVTPGNAQNVLTWGASATPNVSYWVHRGLSAGAVRDSPFATQVVGTSYTDTSAANGTLYYYKVKTYDRRSLSGYSNVASGQPVLPTPPAAPTGVTIEHTTPLRLRLSWDNVAGITWTILRSAFTGGPYTRVGTAGSNIYDDFAVIAETTYFYVVRAGNEAGPSANSSEVSNAATPPLPAAPLGVTATGKNARNTLTWRAATYAGAYSIYRGTSPGGESGTAIATGVTALTYDDTGRTNGTTYYYYIKAINAAGASPASAEVSTLPNPPAAPPANTALVATPIAGSIRLDWTLQAQSDSYNLYRGTATGAESGTALVTGITTAFYVDANGNLGETFFYYIKGVNEGGLGAASNEVSGTINAPPLAASNPNYSANYQAVASYGAAPLLIDADLLTTGYSGA